VRTSVPGQVDAGCPAIEQDRQIRQRLHGSSRWLQRKLGQASPNEAKDLVPQGRGPGWGEGLLGRLPVQWDGSVPRGTTRGSGRVTAKVEPERSSWNAAPQRPAPS
jgi:hypothetical protein